jgi:hypothetical protein
VSRGGAGVVFALPSSLLFLHAAVTLLVWSVDSNSDSLQARSIHREQASISLSSLRSVPGSVRSTLTYLQEVY